MKFSAAACFVDMMKGEKYRRRDEAGTECSVILDTQTGRTNALVDPVVTAIWATVLDSLDLQLSSDFFDLGGDSMKMLAMLFQVTEQTGVEVTPAVLFENPTLDAFCRAVRTLEFSN